MKQRYGQKGFTIIELLVAMFISLLVMAAAYSVFFGSSRAATMQTQDFKMQDNARMAMDVLTRNFMRMGFTVNFGNYSPGTAIGAVAGFGGSTTRLAAVNSGAAADQVVLAGIPDGNPALLQVLAQKGTNQLTLTAVDAARFNAGDVVAIGLSDSALIANIVGSTLNLSTFNPSGLLNLDYPGVASLSTEPAAVVRLTTVDYSIDWADPQHPLLMQQIGPAGVGIAPQPIAEDIEDIQIAYGVDRDSNRLIDATEWIFDGVNGGPFDADQVRLVRITIVARTSREDPRLQGVARTVPAIEDRPARVVTPDGYRRYRLTRILKCKNVDTVITL